MFLQPLYIMEGKSLFWFVWVFLAIPSDAPDSTYGLVLGFGSRTRFLPKEISESPLKADTQVPKRWLNRQLCRRGHSQIWQMSAYLSELHSWPPEIGLHILLFPKLLNSACSQTSPVELVTNNFTFQHLNFLRLGKILHPIGHASV